MKIPKFLVTIEGQFVSVIAVIIIFLFGYYFYSMVQDGTVENVNIEVNATDHIRGAVNGKVTLVEFGDFQCPACGAYEPMVEKVVEANKKDLKFVFRHFPLTMAHPNALIAAKATEAASLQGKFWEMHDLIYTNQKEWTSTISARDFMINYARVLHLDVEKFKKDLENKSIDENILAEYKEGVKLGVDSTPSFFLNGKKIKETPRSFEEFDALIKREILNTK